MNLARIFWTGRSQAVRLPKAFRFDSEQVRIRKEGSAVILEPIPSGWDWLKALVGPVDEDFERAVGEAQTFETRDSMDD
jgi:antitoxin VapB